MLRAMFAVLYKYHQLHAKSESETPILMQHYPGPKKFRAKDLWTFKVENP